MDIEALLGFEFNPQKYEGHARRAFNNAVVSRNIALLHEVSSKVEEKMGACPDINFEALLSLIKKAFKKNLPAKEIKLSDLEIKTLTYNIALKWEYSFIAYCLEIISSNWKITYLRGLLHSLLSQWGEYEPDNQNLLLYNVLKHIEVDQSKVANFLRTVKVDFPNPYKFGRRLLKNNENILTICSLLGLPSNRITYPYFTDAIVSYFEKASYETFEEMRKVLVLHNNVKADKTIIPLWIISQYNGNNISQELFDFAVERIGEPFATEKWAPFPFATREAQTNLEKAQKIMANIVSKKIINIFFEKLCQDEDRKEFWLKYTNHVTDFTIYGTSVSRAAIAYDIDSNILLQHFHVVTTNTTNCALCMSMGKYRIIEFTDTGALYAYAEESAYYKNVFGRRIEKLDDLKLPYIPSLVESSSAYYYSIRNEGRMVHSGYWQDRLSSWIQNKIK